jgi:hypothetical protein
MLAVVAVYSRRDLFPLTTYILKPMDGAQGWLLWSRIGVASLVGIIIPLAIPRTYTPVDPMVSKHLTLILAILTLILTESLKGGESGADGVVVVIPDFHVPGSYHFYSGPSATSPIRVSASISGLR